MIYTIVATLVLFVDQAVKFWTTKNIVPMAIGDECVTLIPGVLHMTNVQNYGAAFSILENAKWFLIGVSAVFIIAIVILINMEIIHTKFGKWTAVLVMAGALGNCIDRVLYGYVVDMFEVELFSFAVFNVADIFITVCGILFCIHVILYREPPEVHAAALLQRSGGPEEEPSPEPEAPRKGKKAKAKRPARRSRPAPVEDFDDEPEETEEAPRPAAKPARAPEKKASRRPAPHGRRLPGIDGQEEDLAAARPGASLEDDDWDDPFLSGAVHQAPAPKAPPARQRPAESRPAPEPKPEPEKPAAPADDLDLGFGDYSLDDILSEFRDS